MNAYTGFFIEHMGRKVLGIVDTGAHLKQGVRLTWVHVTHVFIHNLNCCKLILQSPEEC